MLKQVADVAGFDGDENEWLKICVYYEVFGPTKNQLQDPIKGLSVFSAFETKLGKNVATNYFYYDRIGDNKNRRKFILNGVKLFDED